MPAFLQRLPFYHKHWFQFILFVLRRFEADRCRDQSAALTYTTLFAVVPMLTVFLVIISSIKSLEPARQQLQQMIYSNFLPRSSIAFDQFLNSFAEKSSNLTAIGVIFLFVTTILMLTSIEEAFNRIWRVTETRTGLMGFMRYWTIISLGPIILGSAFALSSTVASMNILSNNFAGYEVDGTFLLWIVSFGLSVVGFFVLYWTIPNRSVPRRAALLAGLLTAALFELLKHLFGYVMRNFTSYELVYGAFAALPIFLLWIYLSWNIVLLGVEISFALTAFHSKKMQTRHPIIMLLDILELFYHQQLVGGSVRESEALDILGRGEMGRWPRYVKLLEQQQLIRRTDNNEYVLVRNLAQVDFWQFVSKLPYPLPHRADLGNIHPDDEWMQIIGPKLLESDDLLAAKLAIPLSKIFEKS